MSEAVGIILFFLIIAAVYCLFRFYQASKSREKLNYVCSCTVDDAIRILNSFNQKYPLEYDPLSEEIMAKALEATRKQFVEWYGRYDFSRYGYPKRQIIMSDTDYFIFELCFGFDSVLNFDELKSYSTLNNQKLFDDNEVMPIKAEEGLASGYYIKLTTYGEKCYRIKNAINTGINEIALKYDKRLANSQRIGHLLTYEKQLRDVRETFYDKYFADKQKLIERIASEQRNQRNDGQYP